VIAFQLSEGLLPDGVAGPRTLTALGLMTDDSLPSSTGELTVQVAAAMCPGAPLGNIKAHLPAVLQAMSDRELVDRPMLLMAVATICAKRAASRRSTNTARGTTRRRVRNRPTSTSTSGATSAIAAPTTARLTRDAASCS
jgi:hypothetical protein